MGSKKEPIPTLNAAEDFCASTSEMIKHSSPFLRVIAL